MIIRESRVWTVGPEAVRNLHPVGKAARGTRNKGLRTDMADFWKHASERWRHCFGLGKAVWRLKIPIYHASHYGPAVALLRDALRD